MIIIFLIWVLLLILVTISGSKREIGGTIIFFISFIFSPIIGLFIVLLSNKLDDNEVICINTKKEFINIKKHLLNKNVVFIEKNNVSNEYELKKKIKKEKTILIDSFSDFQKAKIKLLSFYKNSINKTETKKSTQPISNKNGSDYYEFIDTYNINEYSELVYTLSDKDIDETIQEDNDKELIESCLIEKERRENCL